ncbi:EAL domain-containing protein [Peribacillus glennii]|uniref:EAL domain-containing protein n=1 Tax=Peribacillus glennii TaxID=2303991 RepID=A0A372LC76_9BACI|nr:EAL domain-containing protein [Peribacillus glennii]RFU63504.1 EAL domain-containing protein [Peribacillus glennii]
MENGCNLCGVNFTLHEEGFIYLEGKSGDGLLEAIPGRIENDKGVFIEYHSMAELSRQIDILSLLPEADTFQSTLLKKLEEPFTTYPYREIRARISNNETVQIIQSTDFMGYFQPIVLLRDNSLFAYESLLRDPLGRVSPGQLFRVAQETGMHSLLDQKARETAIKSRGGKIKNGIKSFINFLPSTIYNPEYCLRHTFQIVERYGVTPEDLVFEVVETEKIEDIGHLQKIFRTYKNQGMGVALDDFGEGYSTLDVMVELQPDYVKIDRSKIMNCDSDSGKQEFLKNVVHIARELNIQTLAEGIERMEELQFCKDIGMDLAQGYLIGRPEAEPAFKETALK